MARNSVIELVLGPVDTNLATTQGKKLAPAQGVETELSSLVVARC